MFATRWSAICAPLLFLFSAHCFCQAAELKQEVTIVDLTHELHEDVPLHPAYSPMTRKIRFFGDIVKDGFSFKIEEICQATHLGTHMDAPCHYNQSSWCVTDIPLERFVLVPAAVIDMRHKVFINDTVDAGSQLTEEDIQDWEQKYGKIPDHSLLLILTGWSRFWENNTHYLRSPESSGENDNHHPGLSQSGAEWLMQNRPTIYGVGIDAVSIDLGKSKKFESHKELSAHNVYILENLTNLDKVPATGALITVGAMKLGREASGAPIRAVASYYNTKQ